MNVDLLWNLSAGIILKLVNPERHKCVASMLPENGYGWPNADSLQGL